MILFELAVGFVLMVWAWTLVSGWMAYAAGFGVVVFGLSFALVLAGKVKG